MSESRELVRERVHIVPSGVALEEEWIRCSEVDGPVYLGQELGEPTIAVLEGEAFDRRGRSYPTRSLGSSEYPESVQHVVDDLAARAARHVERGQPDVSREEESVEVLHPPESQDGRGSVSLFGGTSTVGLCLRGPEIVRSGTLPRTCGSVPNSVPGLGNSVRPATACSRWRTFCASPGW